MYRFSLASTVLVCVAAGHVGCRGLGGAQVWHGCPAVLLRGARGYGWSACVDGYLLSLLPSIATECLVTDRPIAAQLVLPSKAQLNSAL